MDTETRPMINGLSTRQMFETIAAIEKQPDLARFQFRARNQWLDGGTNRSTIRDFYGAGQEDDSRSKPFVFTNGEPPVLLGANEGANPVEFLLHALADCSEQELEDLMAYAQAHSPVCNTVCRPVPVTVTRA